MFCLLLTIFVHLFFNSSAILSDSASTFTNVSSRIVGGSVSDIRKFPYAAFLTVYPEYEEIHYNCTAVILSEEWILTAARCFSHNQVRKAVIYVGTTDVGDDNSSLYFNLKKPYLIHPSFDSLTHDFDFALGQLDRKLIWSDSIDLVDLPGRDDQMGKKCWAVGWGYYLPQSRYSKPIGSIHQKEREKKGKDKGEDKTKKGTVDEPLLLPELDLLHEVELPILSDKKCQDIFGSDRPITERMFCAGIPNGRHGICDGDFGGPFVCDGKLYGIASFTKDDSKCGHGPLVYGRVESIIKWIRDETGVIPMS